MLMQGQVCFVPRFTEVGGRQMRYVWCMRHTCELPPQGHLDISIDGLEGLCTTTGVCCAKPHNGRMMALRLLPNRQFHWVTLEISLRNCDRMPCNPQTSMCCPFQLTV